MAFSEAGKILNQILEADTFSVGDRFKALQEIFLIEAGVASEYEDAFYVSSDDAQKLSVVEKESAVRNRVRWFFFFQLVVVFR